MSVPGANEHFNWRTVHSVIVILVLAIFLYTVRGILSPFLVFILLLFVIAPLQGTRLYILIASAAGALTLMWALNATGFLLAPFLLALAFAYIQHPLVTRMERRKISRNWGTLIMAIPTLVILCLLFFVAIPALVIALFTPDPVLGLGKAIGVFLAVQLLDGAVLSPKIVGESVNLHPVWVILALSVFGFFFGFVGLLLAVPLAVLLKLILTYSVKRYRRSRLFLGEERALPAS